MIEAINMGLFSKKKHEEKTPSLPKLPELPSLPQLQDFPRIGEESKDLHQLPTFPTNIIGEKFSQNTIKNAITGRGDEEDIEMEENPLIAKSIEMEPQMQKINPPQNFQENYNMGIPPLTPQKIKPITPTYQRKTISQEPIFIRIDKFEESLKIFENTKEKIKEIEGLLKETKELKIKEEKELSSWEMEIQDLKKQIEVVDKDIFSKIQ